MYRRIVLTAFTAFAASAALAADLPSRGPAPASFVSAPPPFSWTGFYVGLNAGGAFNSSNDGGVTPVGFPVGINGNPVGNIRGNVGGGNNNSFIGGAQIGYNWQMGSIVFGLETDLQFRSRSNNDGTFVAAPIAGLAGVVPYAIANTGGNSSNYFGTVRGRLGYAVDRALFFVSAGIAYGENRNNGAIAYFNQFNAGPAFNAFYTGSSSSNRIGFAGGAGVEYAVTNNWTIKGEYLYADIGSRGNSYTSAALPTTAFVGGNSSRGTHILRMGVNYKF